MKKFYTYIKTGYSSGVYGCNDEYFTWIVIRGNKIGTFRTKGLYGTGYQYAEADVKAMGFEYFPSNAIYGKVTKSDYKDFRWDSEEDITYFAKYGKYKETIMGCDSNVQIEEIHDDKGEVVTAEKDF